MYATVSCVALPSDNDAYFVSHDTFQRDVIYPLLDLGLLNQVGSFLGEDELPETRPEPVPVVLHHWHTVLWEGSIHIFRVDEDG